MSIDLDWYAVVTEAQREEVAQRALRQIGVATYIPEHRSEVRRRHKRVGVIRRTFPGYVFVGLESGREPWMSIDECSAVLGIVGFGNPPAPCRIAAEVVGDVRWRQFCGAHDMARLPIGGGARLKPSDPAAEDLAGRVGRIVQAISDERILVLFGGRRSLLPSTILSRPLDALDLV